MPSYVERIATAALLHDIGKFWSRTGLPAPFTEAEQAMTNTYAHALWSAHFVERFVGDMEMAGWVRDHHQPTESLSRESAFISLADWLSSGEREVDETQYRDQPGSTALLNILTRLQPVKTETTSTEPGPSYFHLIPQGKFDKDFMPVVSAELRETRYQQLWNEFETDIKTLQLSSQTPHVTWLTLLRRYCSRIPSATPTRVGAYLPDINLYEHSRVTAALAACFAADNYSLDFIRQLRVAYVQSDAATEYKTLPICRLVCGNLSGIQDYLYNIRSKGAAKILRARSMTLQLLCETVAHWLCEKIGIPPCCIIYNGGGRFYIFAPLNCNLAALEGELSEIVFELFEGELWILLGGAEVCLTDFYKGAFPQKWAAANADTNNKKLTRFSRFAKLHYHSVFGSNLREDRREPWELVESTEEVSEKDNCFVNFGRDLRNAACLVRIPVTDNNPLPNSDINRYFAPFGVQYEVPDTIEKAIGRTQNQSAAEIIFLNHWPNQATLEHLSAETAWNFKLVANHWPDSNKPDQEVATFEELAERSTGIKKLGILRADVDNLGELFQRGLGASATVSRVATLSSAISEFFEGYVHYLVASAPYRDKLGIIYAGGDDLFIVGAWSEICEFALRLRKDFKRYCGNNPHLSFSGGISIVDDHYPIRVAAEVTQYAEEQAKNYQRGRGGSLVKDALTLFGTPIGFEEIDQFINFRDQLLDLLAPKSSKKPLPQGFLRRLFEIWEVYQHECEAIKKRQENLGKRPLSFTELRDELRFKRWRWLLIYGLREYSKKAGERAEEVRKVQEAILNPNQPIEDRLGVPLRWVELLLRK